MKQFDNILDGLNYTLREVIAKGHSYIINVLGNKEAAKNHAATLQVVPEDFVYKNGELGLTIHLPFDAASPGDFSHLVEFLEMAGNDLFEEYEQDGIPCYVVSLGTNVPLAGRVALYVLEKVYGYSSSSRFTCDVYDEGPLDSSGD